MIERRIASYELIAKVGSGGMGDVYRARDRKLDRDIALKILPDSFASDPDRLARFNGRKLRPISENANSLRFREISRKPL